MPSIPGEFGRRDSAPYIRVTLEVQGIKFGEFPFLVDTGSLHLILIYQQGLLPYDLLHLVETWPEELLSGLGGDRMARRIGTAILYVNDENGQVIPIETDPRGPLYMILYDPLKPEDSYLKYLPKGILGFQNATFGMSLLHVDNANQKVQLDFQEPSTPSIF